MWSVGVLDVVELSKVRKLLASRIGADTQISGEK